MAKRRYGKAAAKRRLKSKIVAVSTVVATLATVGAFTAVGVACRGCSSSPLVTIVATAGTTNETDVAITGEPERLIREAAEADGHLDLVKVDGGGSTEVKSYDLTPRDSRGDELKPVQRRQDVVRAFVASLTRTLNEFDATAPGRAVLAGLQAVPEGGSGPVLVYTSEVLDTDDPMSSIALGFDVDVASVVKQLQAAKELPTALRGRDVFVVLTPSAGAQEAPRQPQRLYVKQLLTEVVKAAGGARVEFIAGQGGLPAGTGGTAPAVPIPPAIGTLKPKTTTGTGPDGQPTAVTQCVLPSALLFQPDSSTLLDEKDARSALARCLRYKTPDTSVEVEGHTACRNAPDSDPAYAKQLSLDRARRVVDLAVDLGVKRRNTTAFGRGDRKPLVKPCQDPANRATVVTITTPKKKENHR